MLAIIKLMYRYQRKRTSISWLISADSFQTLDVKREWVARLCARLAVCELLSDYDGVITIGMYE